MMSEEELNRLELEANSYNCPNKECCEYDKYTSCRLHSYVLCDKFEEWYQAIKDNKLKDIK